MKLINICFFLLYFTLFQGGGGLILTLGSTLNGYCRNSKQENLKVEQINLTDLDK